VLVLDGDCRFCRAAVARLERWFEPRAGSVPWQSADLAALGLTEAECREAVQWSEGGRTAAGADAVAAWLATARRHRRLVRLFPLGLPLGRLLYPVVARNRGRLSRLLRL
jgi:predicted DCC family thiol-disulfide oxidoreductase YuxK